VLGQRTSLAGERVPSTSNRQTVFLMGRSANAGTTAAATVGAAIVNSSNLDVAMFRAVEFGYSRTLLIESAFETASCQSLPMVLRCVSNGRQVFFRVSSLHDRVSAISMCMTSIRLVGKGV
jgi:hypothetical protein